MREYKFILLGAIAVILGPVILNWLFKHQAYFGLFVAEWDASAALMYFGTIVAGLITISGVFFTIKYSQKKYREDVRNQVLPFIVIDLMQAKTKFNLDQGSSKIKEEAGYTEYVLKDYYCVLDGGQIHYQTGLSVPQKRLLNNGFVNTDIVENRLSLKVIDGICVPLIIENVGNGVAINLRFGLVRQDTRMDERQYLPTICLKAFNPIVLHIFSEDCSESSPNLGNYLLSFYYDDIYGNRYHQSFGIVIGCDERQQKCVVTVNMEHRQLIVEGECNG